MISVTIFVVDSLKEMVCSQVHVSITYKISIHLSQVIQTWTKKVPSM